MNKKPLSPHLTIYKLPLAAIISISHRFIGIGIFISLFLMSIFLLNEQFQWCTWVSEFLADSMIPKWKWFFLGGGVVFYILCELRYFIWSLHLGYSQWFIKYSNIFIFVGTLVGAIVWCRFIERMQ